MQLENLNKIETDFNKWKLGKSYKELSCISPRILAKELSITEEEADDFLSVLVDRAQALRVFTGICPNKECKEEFYIDSSKINEKYECDICGTSFKISDGLVNDIEVYYELIKKNNRNVFNTSVNYKSKYFGEDSSIDKVSIDKIIHMPTANYEKSSEIRENNINELSIFISHNENDSKLAEIIIQLLEDIGVSKSVKDGKIFCSSSSNRGIKMGDDIFETIKSKFNDNIVVLFLFTEQFFKSPACLCEMGAAWVKSMNTLPLIMPPQRFEDIKGIFNKNIKGFMLDDEKNFSELIDYFIEKFNLKELGYREYDRIKRKFFDNINNYIKNN